MVDNTEHWHVTKGIPASLIIVVISYLIGMVWWGAKFEARVDVNAAAIARNGDAIAETQETVDEIRDAMAAQAVVNERTYVTLENMARSLVNIDRKLDGQQGGG